MGRTHLASAHITWTLEGSLQGHQLPCAAKTWVRTAETSLDCFMIQDLSRLELQPSPASSKETAGTLASLPDGFPLDTGCIN